MTKDEKIRIAKVLEKMHVDVIEAGFAIASPGDFEAVQAVANNIQADLSWLNYNLNINDLPVFFQCTLFTHINHSDN
jgi:isopropylmalate/homocitrate/citramalate synthase